ncbi:hypothetical protein [Methanocella conradii]|uniref:hypothetical protein n=1 Tax=Methanocella conradii TaxID=1175444 RepID=UPI00157C45A4|nr:hypothetical protein [Methanocella conradii]
MFEKLMKLFKNDKGAKKPPIKSDFLRLKGDVAKKPTVVSSDMKGPPVAMPLPDAGQAQAVVSKPVEDIKPLMQLPPDIDPSQVVIVRRDAKKAEGERFKYVDKPLKPLSDESIKAEVIKYDDKRGGEVIKYKAKPVASSASSDDQEKAGAQVFKYTPTRVEIKN